MPFSYLLPLASEIASVLAFTTGASAVIIGLFIGSGEYNLATGVFLLFLI